MIAEGHLKGTPNCTLVELKYPFTEKDIKAAFNSKLYLSGIEIRIKGWKYEERIAPNCTLVELKSLSGANPRTLSCSPNCTLVELK